MLVNWKPFEKVILETGNDYALHSAAKGLLPIQEISPIGIISQAEPKASLTEDDMAPIADTEDLRLWVDGLDGIDLEGL